MRVRECRFTSWYIGPSSRSEAAFATFDLRCDDCLITSHSTPATSGYRSKAIWSDSLLTGTLANLKIYKGVTTLHQSLGRYLIEAEIGRGEMGVVYRAYDPQIGRTVAIKTISLRGTDFSAQEEYRARFLREARAAGRLSHPGIVTVFDAGEDPESGEPYLVMEHITGQPLSKMLSRTRKLPLATSLQFAQEIAAALDYAHTQGVVHRDIKPSNILVTEGGHAKIADFGVAWLAQEVSQAGEIVGSPAFMAPEQMAGKQADARSDLFSLGVVLYTMLTGFRPFQGNSAKTVCFKVMNIEPVPVSSFQSDIPPELNAIVSRAIAKNPDERYPSGAALAKALQSFRENDAAFAEATEFFAHAVEADAGHVIQRSSGISALQLAAAILTVVVAGSFFAWRISRTHDSPLPPELIKQFRDHPVQTVQAATTKIADTVTKPVVRRFRSPKKLKPVMAAAFAENAGLVSVRVEIQHHLEGARASIWLDDDLVSEQDLSSASQKHSLLRTVEVNQVSHFKFAPGKHWLQVRVVSPSNKYDQIETIQADLKPGADRVLTVYCEKHKLQVSLQ